MKLLLEACVGNYKEALEAYKKGADRIELCQNLLEGGTTPGIGTIKVALKNISIPINVIIRPRGGNFVYSREEVEIMKEDIRICNELGVNGIVIGALKEDNTIDIEVIKDLISVANDLEVTFHMAFDEIENKKKAIDQLVDLNIDRILTKGGKNSAISNLENIKELNKYANNRIIIMPGGGINKDNYKFVHEKTLVNELHGTKII